VATKLTRPITRIIEVEGCKRAIVFTLSDTTITLRPTGRHQDETLRLPLDKILSKFTGQTEALALRRFLK